MSLYDGTHILDIIITEILLLAIIDVAILTMLSIYEYQK